MFQIVLSRPDIYICPLFEAKDFSKIFLDVKQKEFSLSYEAVDRNQFKVSEKQISKADARCWHQNHWHIKHVDIIEMEEKDSWCQPSWSAVHNFEPTSLDCPVGAAHFDPSLLQQERFAHLHSGVWLNTEWEKNISGYILGCQHLSFKEKNYLLLPGKFNSWNWRGKGRGTKTCLFSLVPLSVNLPGIEWHVGWLDTKRHGASVS